MTPRPNFVFILADDLGYADLGCYGARSDCSPNLDRMAAQGLRFTDGYANSPVCSPTRFALATGRWQYRLRGGADEPIGTRTRGSTVLGLPASHPTIASVLRDGGYRTALFGKWHLGFPPLFSPLRSGYEAFFGVNAGGVDYFTHLDYAGVHDLVEGETEVHRDGYLTDLITERAVEYIDRRQGADHASKRAPFLLSVHYTAPHWPWETRADAKLGSSLASIVHVDGGSVPIYQQMIREMDEGIGAILAALDRSGESENTIVVFTSDNGGERFSDNWPLVGGKMDLLEGGIRVPYIVRWPERIAAGGTSSQLVITMDWVATFFAAAGVTAVRDYPLDGIDLGPVLTDPARTIDRDLFWRMKHLGQQAMRRGNWKYLSRNGHEFLFDLDADARERANRARHEPARLQMMRAAYAAWAASVPPIPIDAKTSIPYQPGDLA